MDKFPLTKDGFVALEAELKHLKGVDRPNIIAAIAEARSHGDLSENAEYSAAKEKQSFIEGRIQELEAVISRAQVIDPSQNTGNVIRFGATVVVVDEDTDAEKSYQIVGDYEANIEKNKISLVFAAGQSTHRQRSRRRCRIRRARRQKIFRNSRGHLQIDSL